MNKGEETKICKGLIDKYPDLEEYKLKNKDRLKTQKNAFESILEIITDNSDKSKLYIYLNLLNSRKGKAPIDNPFKDSSSEEEKAEEEEEKAEEEEEEEKPLKIVKKVKKVKKKVEKSKPENNQTTDNEQKMRKQRDNLLKKLKYLQEKHDNICELYEGFKIDYKEVCNERNKLQLTLEKKGWNSEKLKEFDKYKSFYQKYATMVSELDK
tara:strand:+ start:93 stop:722 length:630 start_codon:yes stop_codon:yes gene_type:complete